MSESSKDIERDNKEWMEKKRFAGISQEHLDKVAKDEKEIADSQEEINRHLKAIDEDPECEGWTEEKAQKVEKKKQELKKKIYSD